MSSASRVPETGKRDLPAGAIPFLLLPGADLFARRAERLRELSRGHSLGDYLAFLALIAEGQQKVCDWMSELPSLPPKAPPDREKGRAPLHARFSRRDPAWRSGLTVILEHLKRGGIPAAAQEAVGALMKTDGARLEQRADRILAGELARVPVRELPLVAAALQAYWVSLAAALGEERPGRLEGKEACPVCGSQPVTGLVLGGGEGTRGLRYLSCSLCATKWHLVRLTCSNCASTGGIDYYSLEGSGGAVKAESCRECGFYLKLFYLDKDERMEAVADDLATLALDLLMDGEGRARRGPNLFLHPGSG